MKKVLVVGGAGYIGAHLVLALDERGYFPVIADNFSTSTRKILPLLSQRMKKEVCVYEGDACEEGFLRAVVEKEGKITQAIHLAAYKSVEESIFYPLKYYENNILSLCKLLSSGISRVVFSSSCVVYGRGAPSPIGEGAPQGQATCAYAHTKQIGEQILSDWVESHRLQAQSCTGISLRYFNPIGAHSSGDIGEWPQKKVANLVPLLTQSVLQSTPFFVHGNDYDTKDGTCIRDYLHIMDLAETHIAALEWLHQPKNHQGYDVFNCGTGKGYTVLELIRTFEQVTGMRVPYQFGPRRKGDVAKIYADVRKAKELGINRISRSLAEGLNSSWKWQQTIKKMS